MKALCLSLASLLVFFTGCSNATSQSSPTPSASPQLNPFAKPATVPINILVPWTSYFSTQDGSANWASSVRGIGRGETGLQNSASASFIQELSEEKLRTKNLLIPVGGINAGRNKDQVSAYMNQIVQDRGVSWKKVVYEQAVRLEKISQGNSRFAWQIGNEINGRKINENMHLWAKQPMQKYPANDEWMIPYYVEYYLAPTVEAIRKASQDSYGSDNRIPIVLGSVANSYNSKSRAWLDKLLSYEIKGTYSSSLANRRVSDVVNIVAIHYLLSSADEDWDTVLDELWKRWVNKGRVTGIWSTEELGVKRGRRGQGASTALKVAARSLHWYGSRGINPPNGRISFWGWQLNKTPGTAGNDGMQALYQFLGNSPIKEINQGTDLTSSKSIESYTFQPVNNPNKRVTFVFPRIDPDKALRGEDETPDLEAKQSNGRTRRSEKAILNPPLNLAVTTLPQTFGMTTQGWEGGAVKATLHVFSTEGHQVLQAKTVFQGGKYQVSLPNRIQLSKQAVSLIFLEKK